MTSTAAKPVHRQNRTVADVFVNRDFDSYKDDGKVIRTKMKDVFMGMEIGTEVLVSGSRQRIDLTNEGKIIASLYPFDPVAHKDVKHVKVIGSQKGKRMMDVFQEACLNSGIVLELRKAPVAVMIPSACNND